MDLTKIQGADRWIHARAARALACCREAKQLTESGKYEAAREALNEFWRHVGERPLTGGLDDRTAAEVLLCAGTLAGFLGSVKQIEGAQEFAKDLISESAARFAAAGEVERVAEAQTELAQCYWREGSYDTARVMLDDALAKLPRDSAQRACTLLQSAVVEASATRFNDALGYLTEAAPLFDASDNHARKGAFHMELAIVLQFLSRGERREDYADRALVEYAAASYHLEQAGHTNYRAGVENNFGYFLFDRGRYREAHEHLDCARRLFAGLRDVVHTAQVDETRARVLLAQGRSAEAERLAAAAARSLEAGGQQRLLAEALTTHGVALARLGRHEEARGVLQRAFEVAEQAGDLEGAGAAELAVLEELGGQLSPAEMSAVYELADHLLARSQHRETLDRLRAAARRVVAAARTHNVEFETAGFAYASEHTASLLREAHEVARAHGPVLLTGETGTGKELLARLMHEWSGRPGRFVAINCAALTDTLVESQLFGHVKGSFTDASQDHPGAVRLASGGTIFLDEISELSPVNQGKLLRFIEQGEVHTVGSPAPERVDVRVMAATNRPLAEALEEGRLRADLFYRLQTFHLHLPPLRERIEDIPLIAAQFIEEILRSERKRVRFTPQAVEAMSRLPLRGNARELRSLIHRTVLTAADGSVIEAGAVETLALRQTRKADFADPWANFSLKEEVQRFEEELIERALHDAAGKVSHAARLLGFKHHESLNWRLKNRNKNLSAARLPAKPRKRSIIRPYEPKRG